MRGFLHRTRQIAFHARLAMKGRSLASDIPHSIGSRLQLGTMKEFSNLAAADQSHSVAVATELVRCGAPEHLVTAGLLHDIGKARGCYRISVWHRIAHVLLGRFFPNAIVQLRSHTRPSRGAGTLWALAVHDIVGAEVVRQLGYDERIQWLVRQHQTTGLDDPELELLQAVDDRTLGLSDHDWRGQGPALPDALPDALPTSGALPPK
jgi:HD-like signal output (HDOD) protein